MAKRKKKGTGKRAPKKVTQKSVRQRLSARKQTGGRAAAFKNRISDEKSVRAKLHEMKGSRGRRFSVAKKARRKPQQKKAADNLSAAPLFESALAEQQIAVAADTGESKSTSGDKKQQPAAEEEQPPKREETKADEAPVDTSSEEKDKEEILTPLEEGEIETTSSKKGEDAGTIAAESEEKDDAVPDEAEGEGDVVEEAPVEEEKTGEEPVPEMESEPESEEKIEAAEETAESEAEEETKDEVHAGATEETIGADEIEKPEKTPDLEPSVQQIDEPQDLEPDAEEDESDATETEEARETVTLKDVAKLVDSNAQESAAKEEKSTESVQQPISEEPPEEPDDQEEQVVATAVREEKISSDDSKEPTTEPQSGELPSRTAIAERSETEPQKQPELQKEKTTGSTVRFFTPVKLLTIAAVLLLFGAAGYLLNLPPEIISVAAAEEYNEDYTVTITVEVENAPFNQYFDSWCMLKDSESVPDADDDGWVLAENGVCSFDVSGGNFYIFAKDSLGNISEMKSQNIEINDILAVEIPRKETYLPHGGTQQLEAEIVAIGNVDESIDWSSSDEAVATVSPDGLVTGHSNGTVSVTATTSNGLSAATEVVVTDCIVLPTNEYKQFIPAYYYSEEEAALMDQILFSRVADAGGYGTRGAVIAAARFITLEMPYMIPYFYENGRMDAHPGRPVADGEGRYYHVGLYFSETKFDEIIVSSAGPAIWGAPLMNFQDEGYFTRGQRYPNGLSCSGFVSWAMINGGIDTGDIGAGDYPQYSNEFSDIGERVPLTVDLIKSGGVKVGDLIGKDGHIAIVVGLDDTHIWIAESYFRGVQTVKFTIDRGVIDCDEYHYIINMDHMYYNGDGVYSDTWE